MTFDVSKFLSAVNEVGGLQNATKFSVQVFPRFQSNNRLLEYMCESIDVPDVTVATASVKPLGYGYVRQAALVPVYQQVNASFYDDNDKNVMGFFVDWRNRVVNGDYEPGGAEVMDGRSVMPFQLQYLDDYAARVIISVFNQAGELNRRVVLHDAWPGSVGPVRVAWSAANQIVTIPVSFNYSSLTEATE